MWWPILWLSLTTQADDRRSCSQVVTRSTLVGCVSMHSGELRAAKQRVIAAQALRRRYDTLLPAAPTFSLTMAHRRSTGGNGTARQEDFNWNLSLSSEVSIAGTLSLRTEADELFALATAADNEAQGYDVYQAAWTAYFELLADRERLRLQEQRVALAERLFRAALAQAESGAGALVESIVSEASYLNARQTFLRLLHEQREHQRALRVLVDEELAQNSNADGGLALEGTLDPLVLPKNGSLALKEAAEIKALEKWTLHYRQQALAARRSRIPNPTLQAFVQNDGFLERVWGGGLSIALPIPEPISPFAGAESEHAESSARSAEALLQAKANEQTQRRLDAAKDLQEAQHMAEEYSRERRERVRRALTDLFEAVSTAKIPLKEALLFQNELLTALETDISVRVRLCLASVAFARWHAPRVLAGAEASAGETP